jgi:hypothetical protein
MTSRINNIRNNKLILRDYLGLINEIVYGIETLIETLDDQDEKQELDNKINQMKSYKVIIKEYINLHYTNHFDDNDLYKIYEHAMSYVGEEVRNCYPSIFEYNVYQSVIKNLTDITNDLITKGVINGEIQEYIMDYLNNYNNFEIWKIMYAKCVYLLCNNVTLIRNNYQTSFYSNIQEFENCVNLQNTPINSRIEILMMNILNMWKCRFHIIITKIKLFFHHIHLRIQMMNQMMMMITIIISIH